MNKKNQSRLMVFLLALVVWLLVTSFSDWQAVAVGVGVAALISLLCGDMLAPRGIRLGIKRLSHLVVYLLHLAWEIFLANLHVAYLVIHPALPIKPGIVRIRTDLTSEAALTMLANSITLTPGTLTVDLDREKGILYIHWITVETVEEAKATALIGGRFEKRLREIFQ
ncbi:MAG: Na+/H+ antiporter subunit E [Firmicutes bacterium]|nr:Na+/H+ antiporter subunit E [Bacillota bacterium]